MASATGPVGRLYISMFIFVDMSSQREGQRREPADNDVEFVCERIGWLPFAEPSGSMVLEIMLISLRGVHPTDFQNAIPLSF
jgi:hypothetical protein